MTWLSGVLGADRLYDYIGRFGFGQPTGLRLPGEVSGTVRTNHDPAWTRVDLATNAYGQGIAVTPVQLLQAVAVHRKCALQGLADNSGMVGYCERFVGRCTLVCRVVEDYP